VANSEDGRGVVVGVLLLIVAFLLPFDRPYSEQFERDIYEMTERLKRELDELYQRFGVVAPSSVA
jgi:hypothetical protein